MPRISDIILDDTGTLTAADWDFDPTMGDGSHILAEIDAPEGYSESTVLVSPWL
jgi:hypothetical protein